MVSSYTVCWTVLGGEVVNLIIFLLFGAYRFFLTFDRTPRHRWKFSCCRATSRLDSGFRWRPDWDTPRPLWKESFGNPEIRLLEIFTFDRRRLPVWKFVEISMLDSGRHRTITWTHSFLGCGVVWGKKVNGLMKPYFQVAFQPRISQLCATLAMNTYFLFVRFFHVAGGVVMWCNA